MSGALAGVLAALLLAVLCFALGTARGNWRVWLVGYALAVLALVLAYGGLRSARQAGVSAPAPLVPQTQEQHR